MICPVEPAKPENANPEVAGAKPLFFRHRHIRASLNEWFHVHRNGGAKKPGSGGWLVVLACCFAAWLVYQIFLWIVDVLRAVIHGLAGILDVAAPYLLLIAVAAGVAWWLRRKQ